MSKKKEEEILKHVQMILAERPNVKAAANDINTYFSILDEIPESVTNYLKDQVQKEALNAWIDKGKRGFIVGATGIGKSKIAIDAIQKLEGVNGSKSLIVVPTEKLRDNNWKEEFVKWGMEDTYESSVYSECYASISKLEGNIFDLVILDEAHNITENNSKFFEQNNMVSVMCLSATPPSDDGKQRIFKDLNIPIVYEMDLDTAVKLRLVAPYEILIVETRLDSVDKYIKAGTKEKPFFTTEAAQYAYLNQKISKLMYANTIQAQKALKFSLLQRMRFIYELKSKTKAAKFILDKIPQGERVITFCGSIEEAEDLSQRYLHISDHEGDTGFEEYKTYHSKTTDKWLTAFQNKEIDRLTCVKALNEGINIPSIDYGVIRQLDSNERNTVQRTGRTIRYKPGHIGKIIIIVAVDTKDNDWCTKATGNLDQSKIRRVRYENLVNGSDKID